MASETVRKLDELGRIVIPKEIRNVFGWDTNSDISVLQQDDYVLLRTFRGNCVGCRKLLTTTVGPLTGHLCGDTGCIKKLTRDGKRGPYINPNGYAVLDPSGSITTGISHQTYCTLEIDAQDTYFGM